MEQKTHPTTARTRRNVRRQRQSHSWLTKLASLHADQQKAVQADIGNQLGVVPSDVALHDFSIEQTFLPLGEQDAFVAGKLGKLSEAGLLPFSLSKTAVAACMLATEVQSRASNNSYARDFDELKARVITRKQSIEVLSRVANARPSLLETLDSALQSLEQEKHRVPSAGFPVPVLTALTTWRHTASGRI